MSEKTPWYKKVFIAIGSFLAAMLTFILCGTINRNADDKRSRADSVRDDIDTANAANRDAAARVDDIEHTVEHVEKLNGNIADSNRECQDIIRNVRERNKKRKD